MYKAYEVNAVATESWTKQHLLGYDQVQLYDRIIAADSDNDS